MATAILDRVKKMLPFSKNWISKFIIRHNVQRNRYGTLFVTIFFFLNLILEIEHDIFNMGNTYGVSEKSEHTV